MLPNTEFVWSREEVDSSSFTVHIWDSVNIVIYIRMQD